jgi:hypothetical protein
MKSKFENHLIINYHYSMTQLFDNTFEGLLTVVFEIYEYKYQV